MSARTAGRRRHDEPAEFYDPEGDPAADGVFVRLLARVIENPAMAGGLLVMALTAAAVVSNALFLQRAQHPEPWFATRPAVALGPDGDLVAVPDPRPRAEAAVEPPVPRSQPDPAASPAKAAAPAVSPTLVANLQRALSVRGLYPGKVDGISGAQTRAAISAYEKAAGLAVTGQPTEAILAHMAASPVTVPVAAAPATTPAVVEATPAEVVAAIPEPPAPAIPAAPVAADTAPGEGMLSYPPKAAAAAPAPEPAAAAAPAVVTKASVSPAETAPAAAPAGDIGARRTLSVQKALNMIGYGPVPEDGIAGEGTIAAIRRFELDNGLPVTGAAGDTLIQRLVAIGAMEAA